MCLTYIFYILHVIISILKIFVGMVMFYLSFFTVLPPANWFCYINCDFDCEILPFTNLWGISIRPRSEGEFSSERFSFYFPCITDLGLL